MTKVLALVTDAYGGRGGIAQAARDVIGAVAVQNGVEAVTVLPRYVQDTPIGLPQNVEQLPASRSKLTYSARALATATQISPEIIFCNHLFMAPLAAFLARRTRAKLVVQLHGIEIWKAPTSAQRRALEEADLLLCVSRYTRARVLAHADVAEEKAIVLNNTVGSQFTPNNRNTARKKFGLKDEFSILTVGRLDSREQYKGHEQVISALPSLEHPLGRRIVYLIAGDGDDCARLRCAAGAAGVEDRVIFLGQIPAEDLPDLYRAADLFCMPSTGEGFGIAFIEAMASGTPALGLGAGGASDALGDGELGGCTTASGLLSALQKALAPDSDALEVLPAQLCSRFGREVFHERISRALTLMAEDEI